ncbi:hypothetical protein C5167_010588 [Papaver somniferum]|uniref:Uncharacterized protein n=1 Tax=Papaver somniferum TaxID=3469 RepID=A0A4Y7K3R7_PAPSO|nr:hypothetical protein C5167_010588 [Papaver somniferum]
MGAVISNPVKSAIRDSVKDEEVRKDGVKWEDKEIRAAGSDFVSELLAKDDVIRQTSLILKGVETKLDHASTGITYIAIGVGRREEV